MHAINYLNKTSNNTRLIGLTLQEIPLSMIHSSRGKERNEGINEAKER
jgi:hypothetical protein